MALHPEITEIACVSDDFDSAKGLAVVQDLLSRFPSGEIDAIVMQGPEGGAAVENTLRNQRTDVVVFFSGDYPADNRQFIYDGKIAGTVNQDPYPQAFHAMETSECGSPSRPSIVQSLKRFFHATLASLPRALWKSGVKGSTFSLRALCTAITRSRKKLPYAGSDVGQQFGCKTRSFRACP